MFDTVEIKEVKEDIGQLIRSLRKQQKITQSHLATSLDVSRTTIQNLERGKNFTVDTLLKILKELDLLDQLQQNIRSAKDQAEQAQPLY